MTSKIATIFIFLTALVLFIGISSCSKVEMAKKLEAPKFYTEDQLSQYRALTDAGYTYLEAGNSDSAVIKFMEMSEVIPDGKYNEYNIACVYGRIDDKDKAFEWLEKMVDKGWDNPGRLYEDTDFASLVDDPRFDKIVERTKKNLEANEALFSGGIPVYDTPPLTFEDINEYNEWADRESSRLRSHGNIWFDTQYLKALMDFHGKRLACLKDLKKDDPNFDYGLERVRAISRIKSPYECWDNFARIVVNEADSYLANPGSPDAAAEANFQAGFAYTMESCDGPDSVLLSKSNEYLLKIEEGASFYGPAQTLIIANNLDMNPDNKEQYKETIKSILAEFSEDKWVARIVSTRFHVDAIKMLWPIELGLKDIDNKVVKLDQFKGKVLLIDFWATWCPPCRAELPNLKETYETYSSKGFTIVSISLDYEERTPLDDYRQWIEENGMNWRHIYDGKGWGAELAGKYFISSIPATFLIGKDGKVIASGDECRGEQLMKTVGEEIGI